MIKIDTEKFDEMIEAEVKKDKRYNEYMTNIKPYTNKDDNLINSIISIILRVAEISYNEGFKNGMEFIINTKKLDLFSPN